MSELVNYTFTWHALSDACPKCRALNGKDYVNVDVFKEVVWDPVWGDVWDLDAAVSKAHPNCRCQLELRKIDIDEEALFSELKQLMLDLKSRLLELKGE